MTLVRQDEQYEFTLHAETLGIGSLKFPNLPEEVTDARAKLEERADQLRHFVESLDLLYDAFGQDRLGSKWQKTLPEMQKWLKDS